MTTGPATTGPRSPGSGVPVAGSRPAVVLVARAQDRAAGLVERLRSAGVRVTAAPVIERAPVEDPAPLVTARERLSRGAYAWVVVTSVNAVDALLGPPGDPAGPRAGTAASAPAGPPAPVTAPVTPSVPGGTRWAAVGPATERALARHGIAADLVPGTATAAGLAEAFPPRSPAVGMAVATFDPADHATAIPTATTTATPTAGAGGVLLPLGDLAGDTLARDLAAKGWEPHVVTAYRTVSRTLPTDVVGQAFDLVVVSSGSAAREVAAQLGTGAPVVAIGEPSARAARAAGLAVAATATRPTDESLADAVLATLSPDLPSALGTDHTTALGTDLPTAPKPAPMSPPKEYP